LLIIVVVVFWALPGFAQWVPPPLDTAQGMPTDWTHRHLIFSQPSDPQSLDEVQQEPRYWLQQMQRGHSAAAVTSGSTAEASETASSQVKERRKRPKKVPLKRDWSENLGLGAKVGEPYIQRNFRLISIRRVAQTILSYTTLVWQGLGHSQASLPSITSIKRPVVPQCPRLFGHTIPARAPLSLRLCFLSMARK
jgi:hypothetical protein